MKKIFMYGHGGSGNHGCEAIVRSTIKLLKDFQNEITLISSNPEEDRKYGIDQLCNIILDKQPYSKFSMKFLKAYYLLKVKHDYVPMEKLTYQVAINKVNEGDIALSIGGDNYCYADVEKYILLHDMFLERGAKTVLWGCSVEPELIRNDKIKHDLQRYSLIVARETISYNALKSINPNTVLASDPAFYLTTEDSRLKKECVGINVSPMVIRNESVSGIVLNNYLKLMEYILSDTELNILLIPHVIWRENDDRIPLIELYNQYKNTGRVFLVEDDNCERIKGIIAKCRFFVGARTHSTIAAYSSFVPTLVVGYSVKARGIAKDIFGAEENYVIPVQNMKTEEEIKKAFNWMLSNENKIRNILQMIMPQYKRNMLNVIDKIKEL